MNKFLIAVALSAIAATPVLAQMPAGSAPGASAYEGNVGDWALGRWTGHRFADTTYSRLTMDERVLVVARLPDGRVGCQWLTSGQQTREAWAPQCKISANKISLRNAANVEVELIREGTELDGMYFDVGTRFKIHMKKAGDRQT